MYQATGPGRVEIVTDDKVTGTLEALLYNFDFDDFSGHKFHPLKTAHANFLSSRVFPLIEGNRGNIWLRGSASKIGETDWNMTLSMVRAGQVQAFLLDGGIKSEQIVANAVGESLAKRHSEDDPRDRGVYLWVRPNASVRPPLPTRVPPKPALSRGKLKKLYVYDRSSFLDRMQASGRFDDNEVVTLAIDKGIDELKDSFDILLEHGQIFNRALFQTHGKPGGIWFGNEVLTKYVLTSKFNKYAALFPSVTRIYFDGCNVAGGEDGTNFLLAAGNIFLARGGGEAVGWITLGTAMPGFLPFIGGHTIHFGFDNSNNVKRIRFFPGGSPNFPDSWIPAR